MNSATPGLRERKRLATRRAIQLSVLGLIADRDIDRVTIEEISQRADISPRTFFNYFASKEAAAVGDAPQLSETAAVERFLAEGPDADIMDGIARLLVSAIEAQADDIEMMHVRRGTLKRHPQLFAMRMTSMRTFEEELAGVVRRRLVRDAAGATSSPDEHLLLECARLTTFVAFGTLRYAWARWAESEGAATLTERLLAAFADLRNVVGHPALK